MSSKPSQTPNSSSLYPSMDDLLSQSDAPSSPPTSSSEELLRVHGAVVHLIDKTQSVELAYSDLELFRLIQNGAILAVLARIGDQIQWSLAEDEPSVKLDASHYFFSLRVPSDFETTPDSMLNYGLTVPAKGQEQEQVLTEFDRILAEYRSFSVEKVKAAERWWRMSEETAPAEMEDRKIQVEESAAAYLTTVAPNVEDYSSQVARAIAAGSVKVVKEIL